MIASFVLTVAQSKRLIARAVAQMPVVRRALSEGTVAIAHGTTNAYVAEEILGRPIPKGEYVSGRTLPPGIPYDALGSGQWPDIVLRRGQPVPGARIAQIANEMGPGDVFIKGGNALNYRRGVVGVLIGHPTGGTIGAAYGTIIARQIHLVIPIGLEKLVCEDIESLSAASRAPSSHPSAPAVPLFPITGTIVTEIEALGILCKVSARLLSAGGVAGAEGAVWLLVEGDESAVEGALAMHKSLEGEPGMGATFIVAERPTPSSD